MVLTPFPSSILAENRTHDVLSSLYRLDQKTGIIIIHQSIQRYHYFGGISGKILMHAKNSSSSFYCSYLSVKGGNLNYPNTCNPRYRQFSILKQAALVICGLDIFGYNYSWSKKGLFLRFFRSLSVFLFIVSFKLKINVFDIPGLKIVRNIINTANNEVLFSDLLYALARVYSCL